MEMKDMVAFAKLQEQRFQVLDAGKSTPLERTYAQLVKLGEEYGELCDAVMAEVGHQRADKLAKHSHEKLALEMADVIVVTFILAEKMGVDLPASLQQKIAIIHERFKDVAVESE
jgi:NTP pyrophosphatase (non-canonical NTP hydrolase)